MSEMGAPAQGTLSETVVRRPWRELALFADMCLELSWLALWYAFIVQSQQAVAYWQVVLILGAMMFSSYLFARAIRGLKLNLRARRVLMAGVLIGYVILGLKIFLYPSVPVSLWDMLSRPFRTFRDLATLIPMEFIVMVFVLFVCWRGISRVDRHVGSLEVINDFKMGVLMLLLYGLVARLGRSINGYELYLFLFSSLLAMSAARISVTGYLRGGQRIPFDRRWVLGVSIVILAIVAVSALVVTLVKGQFLEVLKSVLTWTVYIIALILSPLMFLVMRIVIIIGEWLNFSQVFLTISRLLNQLQLFISSLASQLEGWLSHFDSNFLARLMVPLSWIKALVLWGSLLLIILALALMVRNRLIREQTEGDGEFQSLAGQESWLDLLRAALRRGLGRAAESLVQVMGLRNARRALAAARIRRIYAHLMELSENLNHPRPASRTPLEFLPDLENLFPGLKGDLVMITEAYLRVRYGDMPETKEEVESIELAWKDVLTTGKDMLKAMNARK
jgi:Domain of unknown function (DUF4129)